VVLRGFSSFLVSTRKRDVEEAEFRGTHLLA
jgi:hypothetical protein